MLGPPGRPVKKMPDAWLDAGFDDARP